MTKSEFSAKLRKGLSGLPKDDIEERLTFYGEMIDDRVEDGVSEEDAIAEIGSMDDLIAQIVAETPLAKLVKEKMTPKQKSKAWELVLLVLGSPVWLLAGAMVFAVYVSVCAVIFALWCVFAGLFCSGLACVIGCITAFIRGSWLTGLAMIGAGSVSYGLSIFAFFGCKAATKGILFLTGKAVTSVKKCFVDGEDEQ